MGSGSGTPTTSNGRGETKKTAANGSNTILAPTFFFPLLLVTLLLSSSAVPAAAKEVDLLQTGWKTSSHECQGGNSLFECLDDDDDDDLVSSHRRVLYSLHHYISYGALKRNTVPCSIRGASYYNCRPGAQAHPYRRGCSAIARCRIY